MGKELNYDHICRMAYTAERVHRHESNPHPTKVHSTSLYRHHSGQLNTDGMSTNTKKFCAREALKSKISPTETGNTNNSHRKNSRMQRQENSNQNLKSDQDSEEEHDEKKISTTHQLSQFQWDGQRATLRFYIQKWYDLLEGSKSKKSTQSVTTVGSTHI